MLGVSSEKRCPGPSGQFVFLVVFLALVVLTAAPEAGARSVFGLPAQTGAASLGGDRVLSAPSTDEGIPRTPMLISAGKEPRRLREFDPLLGLAAPPDRSDEPGLVGREIALGASARRLAVSLTITRTDYEATYSSTSNALSELWTSGLAGPASRTARCRGDNLRPIAVDGDVVAYGGAACDPNRASLGVRDLSPGGTGGLRVFMGSPLVQFDPVKLAGRHVMGAVSTERGDNPTEEGELVVWDWTTGAETYRIRGPRSLGTFTDLQADGKATAIYNAGEPKFLGGADTVAWFSPAEPRPHVLPVRPCEDSVFIADDRLLFSRPAPGRACEPVLSDLAGSDVQPLRYGTGQAVPRVEFFDGRRIAYTVPRCRGSALVVDAIAELSEQRPPVRDRCVARLPRRGVAVRADPTGAFSLPVACPRGCTGELELRLAGQPRPLTVRQSGGRRATRADFATAPGQAARVSLQLISSTLRRLSRQGAAAMTIRALIRQPNGATLGFSTRVVLATTSPPSRRAAPCLPPESLTIARLPAGRIFRTTVPWAIWACSYAVGRPARLTPLPQSGTALGPDLDAAAPFFSTGDLLGYALIGLDDEENVAVRDLSTGALRFQTRATTSYEGAVDSLVVARSGAAAWIACLPVGDDDPGAPRNGRCATRRRNTASDTGPPEVWRRGARGAERLARGRDIRLGSLRLEAGRQRVSWTQGNRRVFTSLR